MGYPSMDDEVAIVRSEIERGDDAPQPVLDGAQLSEYQRVVKKVPVPDSATTSELGDPQDVVWRNQSSRQRGEWVVAGLRNEIVGLKRQLELATKERDRISRSEEVKGETARQQALDQLVEDQRAVILLRDFEGLSWDHVAQELGRPSAGAARMFHATAMKNLAVLLRKEGGP